MVGKSGIVQMKLRWEKKKKKKVKKVLIPDKVQICEFEKIKKKNKELRFKLKTIQFKETDYNWSQFKIYLHSAKLKYDQFFRMVISGIIERDSNLLEFLGEKSLEKKKIHKKYVYETLKDVNDGKYVKYLFNIEPLSEEEREEIFLQLEREFGE